MLYVALPGGLRIPTLGYGTGQDTDKELETALNNALEVGYRHIDTAYQYENEDVVGRVIQSWLSAGKLKREDLFVVTKLPPSGLRPSGVPKFLKRSLKSLQLEYVDLYLIHSPVGFKDVEGELHHMTKDGKIELDLSTDHVAVWKEMEKQVEAGLTKSIGLSNFNIRQIKRILENSTIKPVNLQVELHLYHQQKQLVEFCKKNSISVTAYSPLASPGRIGKRVQFPLILEDEEVKRIAKKYQKTEAQVLLRHHVQNGLIAIPKSTSSERMRQNFEIFDFTLDGDDMTKLDSLDRGDSVMMREVKKHLSGVEKHPEFPFPE